MELFHFNICGEVKARMHRMSILHCLKKNGKFAATFFPITNIIKDNMFSQNTCFQNENGNF